MKRVLVVVAIVAALAIGGYLLASRGNDEPESQTAPSQSAPKQNVEVPTLLIGSPDASINIVEYGDFQCPICKRFFEQVEPQLLSQYINNGKAKIDFRVETHIGDESITSAQAAFCANDQGKFKAYHDELYKRQASADSGAFSNQNLKAMAKAVGLDQASFDACLDGGKFAEAVKKSDQAAEAAGVNATPTFLIGERTIVGAQPFNIFKTVIDEQLVGSP